MYVCVCVGVRVCVCVLQKLWRCVCAVSGWWQRRRWKRRVLQPNWTAVGCFHEWIGCRPPKTPSVNIKLPKPWSTERKNSTHKEMPTSEKVVFYCVPGLHLAGVVLLVFPVLVRLSSCHFLFVPFSQFCLFGFFFFFFHKMYLAKYMTAENQFWSQVVCDHFSATHWPCLGT